MLILERKPGEAVFIGDDVVVTVLSVRGAQVRIGIDAPRTIQIHRDDAKRDQFGRLRDAGS